IRRPNSRLWFPFGSSIFSQTFRNSSFYKFHFGGFPMADVLSIVTGHGRLFLAPETVAIPTLSGSDGDFGGFDLLGYTDDGIEADHTSTDKEIRVDEETDPVDVLTDKESNMVAVKLAEATMQNLYYAMA